MSAPPRMPSHFPAGAWWRDKLRALGGYLRRAEARSRAPKTGSNGNGSPHHEHDTGEEKP